MLLLHTLSTCADAGPDLCTFCPDLCTLCPDRCTLRLWCYSSIKQRKYSTCTHGGGHWLQPALVEFFLQPLMQTLLAPVVVSPVATCAGGLFPSTHWRTYSTCAGATCTVWWWSVVVVVTCGSGGGSLYIYIKCLCIYIIYLHCIYKLIYIYIFVLVLYIYLYIYNNLYYIYIS